MEQLRVGRVFTVASFLGMGNQRVVDLVVGAFLGPVALGYLRIAWRALELLLELTISSINRVLLPALSRASTQTGGLPSTYNHGITMAALVAYPLFSGVALVAPDALPLVFGAQWETSVPLVQLLAMSVLFVPLIYFKSTLLFVANKLAAIIWLNVLEFILSVAVTLVAVQVGLAAAAYGNTVRLAIATPVIMFVVGRVAGIDATRSCASVLDPLYATALMVAGLLLVEPVMPHEPILRVSIMVGTGAAIYGLAICILMGRRLWDLFGVERGSIM